MMRRGFRLGRRLRGEALGRGAGLRGGEVELGARFALALRPRRGRGRRGKPRGHGLLQEDVRVAENVTTVRARPSVADAAASAAGVFARFAWFRDALSCFAVSMITSVISKASLRPSSLVDGTTIVGPRRAVDSKAKNQFETHDAPTRGRGRHEDARRAGTRGQFGRDDARGAEESARETRDRPGRQDAPAWRRFEREPRRLHGDLSRTISRTDARAISRFITARKVPQGEPSFRSGLQYVGRFGRRPSAVARPHSARACSTRWRTSSTSSSPPA